MRKHILCAGKALIGTDIRGFDDESAEPAFCVKPDRRVLARDQLVCKYAKGVDIAAAVGLCKPELFGRSLCRRPPQNCVTALALSV